MRYRANAAARTDDLSVSASAGTEGGTTSNVAPFLVRRAGLENRRASEGAGRGINRVSSGLRELAEPTRGIDVLSHKSGPGALPKSGPEPNEEETTLLAQAAAGDERAFRGLVDRHLPTVLAIARRMLKDDAEAEDVAQEALLRLWRNAAGLELGPGGARPWLRRVVSNLCIDRVRARRNTTTFDVAPEESEPAGQVRHLAERELSHRVDAALKALPERQRLALTLFHYEGMSQIEVGEARGISDEAVEALLARARRTLKGALKDEWRELIPDSEPWTND
jgi:RNA polymerase sigma-70 factor (ECF subfamily)